MTIALTIFFVEATKWNPFVSLLASPCWRAVVSRGHQQDEGLCCRQERAAASDEVLHPGKTVSQGLGVQHQFELCLQDGADGLFAAALMALLFIPLAGVEPVFAFHGDVIVLFYIMGIGRFFTIAAALDTASPFEGMGAAREAFFATLAEATIFTVLILFFRMNGSLSFADYFHGDNPISLLGPAGSLLLLVIVAMFMVLLTENSRVPVDDPQTHLELTMIHEVMILDHSGPDLALIELGAFYKLFFYSAFLTHLIQPFTFSGTLANALVFYAVLAGVYVAVGIIESCHGQIQDEPGAQVYTDILYPGVFRRYPNHGICQMINYADAILVVILLSVLLSLESNRLVALVKIMGLQGIMVSLVPLFLEQHSNLSSGGLIFFQIMILIKGLLIPGLLYFAVQRVAIKREVEPIIGYHASLFAGLIMILVSLFITDKLQVTLPGGHNLLLITAITTLSAGLFLMMSRTKAITQVIGYLMLENGIYLVGTALTKQSHTRYVVEFGVLLDVLVGVMIMGIILHNINHAFDDVDTGLLGRLKD
jgi:hydrogenase-4 component E